MRGKCFTPFETFNCSIQYWIIFTDDHRYVLEAVVSLGGTYTFLTPHWVYRAGTIIIQNMPTIYEADVIQLYSNTVHVLELSSWKWPSSAALNASLADLMTHLKSKYRPNWADKLRLGDVRI